MTRTERDFEWTPESETIRGQDPIAVYENPHGEVVIRQSHLMMDEDVFVVISRAYLRVLIDALIALEQEPK